MFIRPSFKAGNSQIMLNYKLEIRKHLKSFNDDSLPDGCTLESLKCRRMAVAKLIFGKLGRSTDIEAPFFCTWGCNTFIGVNVYMNRKLVSNFYHFWFVNSPMWWTVLIVPQRIDLRFGPSLGRRPNAYWS
jgi:hypothetical protein